MQNKLQTEKEAGTRFLEENAKQPGVVTLPEGVQYKIIEEGSGIRPAVNSNIEAHYSGQLLNGTVFDSSFKRGRPFTARVSALIKAWQLVLPLMPVGSRWMIWSPSDYAYGDRGTGGIPGGAVLQFEIQLLRILD